MDGVFPGPDGDANRIQDPMGLVAASLLFPTGVDGIYGRSGMYEDVINGLSSLISRHREPGTEVLRFPPVMNRHVLEKSGYLKSFPNLLGCVCALHGTEAEIRCAADGGDWTSSLMPADLVLTPAACYPVTRWWRAAVRCHRVACGSTLRVTAFGANHR